MFFYRKKICITKKLYFTIYVSSIVSPHGDDVLKAPLDVKLFLEMFFTKLMSQFSPNYFIRRMHRSQKLCYKTLHERFVPTCACKQINQTESKSHLIAKKNNGLLAINSENATIIKLILVV